MTRIQVYGPLGNYLSVANVCRSVCKEMIKGGLDFQVWSVGDLVSPYVDAPFQQGMSKAPIGIGFGYPPEMRNCLKDHSFKILFTVCETDRIPGSWVDVCSEMDLIVVPSKYCRQAFIDSGVKKSIAVVPHGVHSYLLNHEPKRTNAFAHFSGSISFARRKGTVRLLRAYKELKDLPQLHVFTPNEVQMGAVVNEIGLSDSSVKVIQTSKGYRPAEMQALLKSYSAIIAPSRAEGFGIIPLEARCLGIPVVLTRSTGHTEHFAEECDTEIKVGMYAPLDTQGNSSGAAPRLAVSDIKDALVSISERTSRQIDSTRNWASRSVQNWTWSSVTRPFIKTLKEIARKYSGPRTLGAGIG